VQASATPKPGPVIACIGGVLGRDSFISSYLVASPFHSSFLALHFSHLTPLSYICAPAQRLFALVCSKLDDPSKEELMRHIGALRQTELLLART